MSCEVSKIKVIYFNARSLKNKLPSLHNILYNNVYEIICVTESWLDGDFSNGLLDPKGHFNIYRIDRASNNPAAGVCIFVKRHINSAATDIHSDFIFVELVALKIFLDVTSVITLVCCYIPPSISKEWFNSTVSCLQNICSPADSCILVGDFNLPNIDWVGNIFPGDFKSQLFLNFFTTCGFVQYIDEFTRKNSILDLLCCNDPLLLSDFSVIVPFHNSDHDSIEFSIAAESNDLRNPSINGSLNQTKYIWPKADWLSFDNYLSTFNWHAVFATGHNIDEIGVV